MSSKDSSDVIDVESRVVSTVTVDDSPAAAIEATPTLPASLEQALVPAFEAKTEIAKADIAITAAKALVDEIVKADIAKIDTSTKDGEEKIRALLRRCVKQRTGTKNAYETWNRPLLDAQKGLREVVKKVEEIVQPHENALGAIVERIDAEREAEKQRKIEAERARIEALRTKITGLSDATVAAVSMTSAQVEAKVGELQELSITDAEDSFGEFSEEAAALRGRVISTLLEMFRSKRAAEEEAVRLDDERRRQQEEQRLREIEAGLRVRITAIQSKAFSAMGKPAAQIKQVLDDLVLHEPLALEFESLYDEALQVWQTARTSLETMHASQKQLEEHQAEAARLQRQRELEERERAQAAERERLAAEEATKPAPQTIVPPQTNDEREMVDEEFRLTAQDAAAIADDHNSAGEKAAAMAENQAFVADFMSGELPAEEVRLAPAMSQYASRADFEEARALFVAQSTWDRSTVGGVMDDILGTLDMGDYPTTDAGTLTAVSLLLNPEIQAALRERQAELLKQGS